MITTSCFLLKSFVIANSVGIIFLIFLFKTLQIVWIVSYFDSGIKIFKREILISSGLSCNNFFVFFLSALISETHQIINLTSFLL